MPLEVRLSIDFNPAKGAVLGEITCFVATIALAALNELLEEVRMALAIVGMDVIGEGSAERLFDFISGNAGPGGVEKGPEAGLIDLKDDLLDVLDDGLVPE